MKKEKIHLSEKEINDRKFFYVDFGSETHGRTTFRLWVHYSLVKKDKKTGKPYVEFPIEEATVHDGKKPKTKILRPNKGTWVAHFFQPCGYRGSASVECKEAIKTEKFWIYRSPRGNLGVSEGALFVIPDQYEAATIKWQRTGRLYGAEPEGVIILYRNGRQEKLENVDLCEIEDLAEIE